MKLPIAVLTLLASGAALAQFLSSPAMNQAVNRADMAVAARGEPSDVGIGPWRDVWSQVPALNHRSKIVLLMTTKGGTGSDWDEVNGLISRMTGVPNAYLSPEYAHYRAGTKVMMVSGYGPDANSIPIDPEFTRAGEANPSGYATRAQLRHPRWIHMVQPLTQEEVNCLAISIRAGRPVGCGDQWQTGITDDKLACFNGQTYLRCHLDCIEDIYSRDLQATPGACADPASLPAEAPAESEAVVEAEQPASEPAVELPEAAPKNGRFNFEAHYTFPTVQSQSSVVVEEAP